MSGNYLLHCVVHYPNGPKYHLVRPNPVTKEWAEEEWIDSEAQGKWERKNIKTPHLVKEEEGLDWILLPLIPGLQPLVHDGCEFVPMEPNGNDMMDPDDDNGWVIGEVDPQWPSPYARNNAEAGVLNKPAPTDADYQQVLAEASRVPQPQVSEESSPWPYPLPAPNTDTLEGRLEFHRRILEHPDLCAWCGSTTDHGHCNKGCGEPFPVHPKEHTASKDCCCVACMFPIRPLDEPIPAR